MSSSPLDSLVPPPLQATLIKSLERRWGLTTVTFLPQPAHRAYEEVCRDLPGLWSDDTTDPVRDGRARIEFPDPEQLHCTHLTLTRSDPAGPVQSADFLKPGHTLEEVLETIRSVTRDLEPFDVAFDRLAIGRNRLTIIALGQCIDSSAMETRTRLITGLLEQLRRICNLAPRDRDQDPSAYRTVHSSWGIVKRSPPGGMDAFARRLAEVNLDVRCRFAQISLVHHRHRSLLFPQQGHVVFPLGGEPTVPGDRFAEDVGLS